MSGSNVIAIVMKIFLIFTFIVAIAHCEFTSENESVDIANHGFDIYRKIYDTSENLVFSPLSFRVLYSILYQSSSGETENELRSQLFASTHDADKKFTQSIQSTALNRILSSDKVKLANKLYLSEAAVLRQDFKTLVAEYKSEVEQVDFSKNVEIATKMNDWVEEKTNHLITNLVEVDSVSTDTSLFLINALYFKAQWLSPFSKYALRNRIFNNIDGSQSEIEFIHDEDHYLMANNDVLKLDVLQLPYEEKSNFVFWIIVPRDGSSLADLKSNLNAEFIHKVNESLAWVRSTIIFPTFTIECGVDGKKISPVLFQKAELNMLENASPLKVDEIKQKTKIIVNTDGTEAASSTYGKVVNLSAYIGETKHFTADRPFLFAVLTEDHKEPIFIGHYVNANK